MNTPEMVILAELLLRGPQTQGELRGRASRMHPLESLEMVRNVLQQLMNKPEPLVRQIAPAGGSRAERYEQLLCPGLHATGGAAELAESEEAETSTAMAAAMAPGATPWPSGWRPGDGGGGAAGGVSKLADEIGASDPLAPAGEGDVSSGGRRLEGWAGHPARRPGAGRARSGIRSTWRRRWRGGGRRCALVASSFGPRPAGVECVELGRRG